MDDCRQIKPLQDCKAFLGKGYPKRGLYRLQLPNGKPFDVFCDQTTHGGGWIVIMRRQNGPVKFDRLWHDYKIGFGQLEKEFWAGNDKIHLLTKPEVAPKSSELLIEMKDKGYALYESFRIENETSKYRLKVSGRHSGTAKRTESLLYHNNAVFSTKDIKNNVGYSIYGSPFYCHDNTHGGWWFVKPKECYRVYLTGRYYRDPTGEIDRMSWAHKVTRWSVMRTDRPYYAKYETPTFVEMKIRRK